MRYADRLLEELEAVFPGVRDHVTFSEGASPRTMERYALNLTGAIYGWEGPPDRSRSGRLHGGARFPRRAPGFCRVTRRCVAGERVSR